MLLTEYDYDTDIAVQRQEAYEDGMEQGIQQGSHQKAIETAKNLLNLGDSLEKVAQVTGLSIEEINNLAK